MPAYTTFSISVEKGSRLRELAKLEGCTAASLVGRWIDDAAESAGLDTTSASVRMVRRSETGTTLLELFGAFVVEMSDLNVKCFADDLERIALSGGAMLSLDDNYEITRRGPAVIIRAPNAISRATNRTLPMKKSVACDEAIGIARAIREALA